jgi:nucleoside-diphosphate-sugar epimerase
VADCATGAIVSESSPLERFPERRGNYTASKLKAERCVTEFMEAGDVPTVVLRPGTIYGPGGDIYTAMMGFSRGSLYIVIGMGGLLLPLVYVDNVVDAIVLSLEKAEAVGQIFNVVDPDRLDKRAYMNRVVRRVDTKTWALYVPYSLLYVIVWLQERAFGLMKKPPILTCYRLTSSQKGVVYDSRRIADRLGWKPSVSMGDAVGRIVASAALKQSGRGGRFRPNPTARPVEPGSINDSCT